MARTPREPIVRWMWTDDLAALLVERELADPADVAVWRARPYAVSVEPDADPLDVAGRLLGPAEAETAA